MMSEDYRGHRIAAINCGPRGWRAYIDMTDVTDQELQPLTAEVALAQAKREVDLAYEAELAARLRASGAPVLRLVHDADAEARMAASVERMAENYDDHGGD